MKTLFVIAAVLFVVYTIDAAPRPKPTTAGPTRKQNANVIRIATRNTHRNTRAQSPTALKNQKVNPNEKNGKKKRQFLELFSGGSVYPNYFLEHPAPFSPYQNAFLQTLFQPSADSGDFATLLKQANLTDANGKPLPLDAKTGAAFQSSFGDKKDAGNVTAKIFSFDHLGNVNIVNPFLAAKDADGKLIKADSGLPGVKAGKDFNGKGVSLVNPYRGSQLDLVFGPEIAPRYEIHYTPQNFQPIATPLSASGLVGPSQSAPSLIVPGIPHGAVFNDAGFNGLGFGGYELGLHPGFGPYPLPFLPAFDPKSLKPSGKGNGSGNGAKQPDGSSTEQPAETTSESFQESTSESSSEPSNSETSSESSTDASS